jgi:hypothetical protein
VTDPDSRKGWYYIAPTTLLLLERPLDRAAMPGTAPSHATPRAYRWYQQTNPTSVALYCYMARHGYNNFFVGHIAARPSIITSLQLTPKHKTTYPTPREE